jgi:hypothetical protein
MTTLRWRARLVPTSKAACAPGLTRHETIYQSPCSACLRWCPDTASRRLRRSEVAATTLLAALIAAATLTDADGFAGWFRPAGAAVGAVVAWRRLPFVVVVVIAALTTAGLRLAGAR